MQGSEPSAPMKLLAIADLASYLEYTTHGMWQRAKHLEVLCQALEDVEKRNCTRLVVEMPPRHGKSEVVSKGFPAWYLGKHPDHNIILASYGADLSEKFSRIVRSKTQEYGPSLFNINVSEDSSAVNNWEIAGCRGGLIAAGVNGPLTGHGADIAIIDDPIKSAAEANSSTYRDHTLEWYQTVLRTRLAPNGAIIIVMTRWHKDDLVGTLLKNAETGSEQWRVIRMPAIADEHDILGRVPGEPLWPERFTLADLIDTKSSMTTYQWSALYQQNPIDVEGALWKFDTIGLNRVASTPPLRRILVAVDPAVTATQNSDETGIIVGGIDAEDHIYILADRSLIGTPLQWARRVADAYDEFSADRVIAEVNQGGDLVETNLRMVNKTIPYKPVRATRGKLIRAEPVAALYEQGRVHHVGTFSELEDQLCSWSPLDTKSPDRLDALVWLCTALADKTPAYQPPLVYAH